MKYAVIQAHRSEFRIALMCRALRVSRSGFYDWAKREPSERTGDEQRLRLEIRSIYRKNRRVYGSPRVHRALRKRGIVCSRKRVERLMREDSIRAKKKRRFSVKEVEGVNRVWISDITYLPTREGWLGRPLGSWPWSWIWPLGASWVGR